MLSHVQSGNLRKLPSVNDLLQEDSLRFPADHIPRSLMTDIIRAVRECTGSA